MIPRSLPASQPSSEADRKIREARAAYFDSFSSGNGERLDDRDHDPGPPAMTFHDSVYKSELPADLSDVIVLGTIVGVQPFLSRDHGALYTETTVKIERLVSVVDGLSDPGLPWTSSWTAERCSCRMAASSSRSPLVWATSFSRTAGTSSF
jgi:hypothetical protein